MFRLDGLGNIRKVRWTQLKPGMIILSGVSINDNPIPELRNFPVLTESMLYQLKKKYQFLSEREVIAAEAVFNFSPHELSTQFEEAEDQRKTFNTLREDYQNEKKVILTDLGLNSGIDIPLINSSAVDQDFLIKDSDNSFSYMYGLDEEVEPVPSFLHSLDLSLSFADLLTGRLKQKFNLPDDKDVLLHIVIDFSKSMDSRGKLDLVLDTVGYFTDFYTRMTENTRMKYYAFSDDCRPVDFPVRAAGISRGNTSYSSFMKKVLRFRDPDVYNKIILFTDGLPTDQIEALHTAELLKKKKIDYTQIIFDIKDEQRNEIAFKDGNGFAVDNVVEEVTEQMIETVLSDDELDLKMKAVFENFSEIARACGGNQIILKINGVLKIVTVECYDRYLGLLSRGTK